MSRAVALGNYRLPGDSTSMTTAMMRTFEFEGRVLSFAEREGEWWVTADQVRDALGYRHRDQVTKLYARHSGEFLVTESCTVTLTVQGQGREARVFSPKGVEHLAILGRTEKCVRFRRWLLDVVLPALRNQGPSLLALVEQLRAEVATLKSTQAALIDISRVQAGAMASALARRGAQKRLEKKATRALESGQRLLISGAEPVRTIPDLRPRRLSRRRNSPPPVGEASHG